MSKSPVLVRFGAGVCVAPLAFPLFIVGLACLIAIYAVSCVSAFLFLPLYVVFGEEHSHELDRLCAVGGNAERAIPTGTGGQA